MRIPDLGVNCLNRFISFGSRTLHGIQRFYIGGNLLKEAAINGFKLQGFGCFPGLELLIVEKGLKRKLLFWPQEPENVLSFPAAPARSYCRAAQTMVIYTAHCKSL